MESAHFTSHFEKASHPSPRLRPYQNATSTHSSTPPIAMPTSSTTGWQKSAHQLPDKDSNDEFSMKDRQQAQRGRRGRPPSISFDSQVTIGGGREIAHAPLSHFGGMTKSSSSLSSDDAEDRCSYESDLSSSLSGGTSNYPRRRSGNMPRPRRTNTAAHKFLLSPPLSDGPDDNVSLTSDSTLLSPMSEFHTPPNVVGGYFEHRGSKRNYPLSPWSAIESENLRRNTYSYEQPKFAHPRRRTLSNRSANSCPTGRSPASAFLLSFGKHSSTVEPDSEGQEVGSYILGKEIGSGGFSSVKEAFSLEDSHSGSHAVKIVRKRLHANDAENDKLQAEFDYEISLWRYLYHSNVVSLISVFDTPFATFAFMPLYRDGSLFDLMKKPHNRHGLPEWQARRYSFQLAGALRYLHQDMHIMHGDVKLENCLLDLSDDTHEGGKIVLCDFGLARFLKHDDEEATERRTVDQQVYCITGSLPYSAPELIQSRQSCDTSIDVWAFAVTVYAMHTGGLPFVHTLPQKLIGMILSGTWDVERLRRAKGLRDAGKTRVEELVQVIEGCLCADPARRWSINDVLESAWFEGLR